MAFGKRKAAVMVTAALLGLGLIGTAAASHSLSLAGSNFEIDPDANLIRDDPAPSEDWATIPQGSAAGQERRKAELFIGAQDESFGEGTKEDTAVPTIVNGSIPPNKSDLLTFGAYLEENAAGRFLNIYWHRVQEPQGTTNMDFEFNKSSVLSSNGVTPVRTAGDVLIQYDLAQGGINPELFLSRWVTTGSNSQCEANGGKVPCWSDRVNLSDAGDAVGSINTTPIQAADSDGLGAMSPRTFGEAQIDFDAFAGGGGGCTSFGSAYLKSRSSDSFTAALKDFIPPLTLNFSNCGSIHVIKHDDATPPALLDGAEFDLLKDNAPIGGSPGAEDDFVDDCITVAGVCDFIDVLQGEYWVVETVAPAGHALPNPAFQHVTVTADEQVTVTFVNPRQRGAIQLTKTEKHAAEADGVRPHAGVNFTIAGQPVTTDANGQACVGNLLFGSYNVVETVPEGYVADGDTTKSVTVDQAGTCAAGFETVSFSNTPLSNITVSFSSQVPGGTAATIDCTGLTATPPDGTPNAFDDTSETFEDLEPDTYNCTVVIDP
jgi:Prealbumin-like fold domain